MTWTEGNCEALSFRIGGLPRFPGRVARFHGVLNCSMRGRFLEEGDYVYMSVLPHDPEVRNYLEARVDACLRDLITTRLKQRGQSPARPMVTEGEDEGDGRG
jgi:hypothetical protein